MKTWRERIVEAQARRKFTQEDKDLAADWATCAVGEQRLIHPLVVKMPTNPRGPWWVGRPEDDVLMDLGCADGFYDAVRRHAYRKADRILDQIEDRVLQLKRES